MSAKISSQKFNNPPIHLFQHYNSQLKSEILIYYFFVTIYLISWHLNANWNMDNKSRKNVLKRSNKYMNLTNIAHGFFSWEFMFVLWFFIELFLGPWIIAWNWNTNLSKWHIFWNGCYLNLVYWILLWNNNEPHCWILTILKN